MITRIKTYKLAISVKNFCYLETNACDTFRVSFEIELQLFTDRTAEWFL